MRLLSLISSFSISISISISISFSFSFSLFFFFFFLFHFHFYFWLLLFHFFFFFSFSFSLSISLFIFTFTFFTFLFKIALKNRKSWLFFLFLFFESKDRSFINLSKWRHKEFYLWFYCWLFWMLMPDSGWHFLQQMLVQVRVVLGQQIVFLGMMKTITGMLAIPMPGLVQFQEVTMIRTSNNTFAQGLLIQCLLEVIVFTKIDKIVIFIDRFILLNAGLKWLNVLNISSSLSFWFFSRN